MHTSFYSYIIPTTGSHLNSIRNTLKTPTPLGRNFSKKRVSTYLFDGDLRVHEQAVLGVVLDVVHEVHALVERQLGRVVLGEGVGRVGSQRAGQLRVLL